MTEDKRSQFIKDLLAAEEVLTFDQLLKTFRKELKMTQVEFAEHINKTQENISQYENKKHLPENAQDIINMARVIGVPVSYIHQAIDASRRGIVKKYKPEVINLSKLSKEELEQKYKMLYEDEEVDFGTVIKILEIIKNKL